MRRRARSQIEVPAAVASRGAAWIRAQRQRLRPLARPLAAAERTAFAPHLPPATLRVARVVVVPSISAPRPVPGPRWLRLAGLLEFTGLEALTFGDTIAFARRHMPAPEIVMPLLFHELVHVVQFQQFGIAGFVRRYVEGWLNHEYIYKRIPLERQAFDLEERFKRRPRRPIAVEAMIRRLED